MYCIEGLMSIFSVYIYSYIIANTVNQVLIGLLDHCLGLLSSAQKLYNTPMSKCKYEGCHCPHLPTLCSRGSP